MSTVYQPDGVTLNVWRGGQEVYYGFSNYVPSVPNGWNIFSNTIWENSFGYGVFLQMTGDNGGSPPRTYAFGVPLAGGGAKWYTTNGVNDSGTGTVFPAFVTENVWTDWTIYVKWNTFSGSGPWTPNADGAVTVWMNGTNIFGLTNLVNLYPQTTDANGPYAYTEYNFYRSAFSYPNLMFFDQIKQGSTFAIVQP